MVFSEITRDRLRRFRRIRRAWFSLWILVVAFGLSLLSEGIANNRPLILRHEGKTYFPAMKFYPASEFGLPYATEADYLVLRDDAAFRERGGWMLHPINRFGPLHPNLDLAGNPPHAPSLRHWLGTDNTARDVFARLLYGFRISMAFALVTAAISAFLGIVIGGIQGYRGGWVDLFAQRGIEIWSSLPFLYVVILIGAVYGRSFWLLVFIVALFDWIGLSYYMRGEFLKLREQNFVRAAKALGLPPSRIFFRHILPNAMTPVVTVLPFLIIAGISSLTALDFLGFGLQPPTPSWGELLHQGLENLHAPWLANTTVIALFITLMLCTFVGEGIREAFDPKSDARYDG